MQAQMQMQAQVHAQMHASGAGAAPTAQWGGHYHPQQMAGYGMQQQHQQPNYPDTAAGMLRRSSGPVPPTHSQQQQSAPAQPAQPAAHAVASQPAQPAAQWAPTGRAPANTPLDPRTAAMSGNVAGGPATQGHSRSNQSDGSHHSSNNNLSSSGGGNSTSRQHSSRSSRGQQDPGSAGDELSADQGAQLQSRVRFLMNATQQGAQTGAPAAANANAASTPTPAPAVPAASLAPSTTTATAAATAAPASVTESAAPGLQRPLCPTDACLDRLVKELGYGSNKVTARLEKVQALTDMRNLNKCTTNVLKNILRIANTDFDYNMTLSGNKPALIERVISIATGGVGPITRFRGGTGPAPAAAPIKPSVATPHTSSAPVSTSAASAAAAYKAPPRSSDLAFTFEDPYCRLERIFASSTVTSGNVTVTFQLEDSILTSVRNS
jgi:hypothetical protein